MNPFDILSYSPENFILYCGEAMLRGVNNNKEGDFISLWLDGDDRKNFEGLVASPEAPEKGTRLIIVAIELGDDQAPINQTQKSKLKKVMTRAVSELPTDKYTQVSAIMCKEVLFHEFLAYRLRKMGKDKKDSLMWYMPYKLAARGYDVFKRDDYAEEFSRRFVHWWCGVKSRAYIYSSGHARSKFDSLRADYLDWKRHLP